MNTYVAFLRGINVSGHHKVPMAELRKEMEKLNFEKVTTILNSGNIIFETTKDDVKSLEKMISDHLEKTFGFPIPTIIRKSEMMYHLLDCDPFRDILITKDIRLYVSFLHEDVETDLQLPWTSDNNAFKIIDKIDKTIVSVLDLSITKTPKGMEVLERYFGKHITTRNWNTIKRIEKKLEVNS
ncbi:uncharacterized protein (DUF1697 family) [Aquimarina sp. MAR_2010_214]|uniref:DUF1697 domain-containing protein n=1 Tax=Aquimarina sp. MAR_2010_214 TaxID=1250026 RepID=UPI000C6FF6B8|nr:DUF1697 domain-containing protein [Aquimarina sp. MAR_2010_214]PKV51660.1 uncharacterized protein (DUF1697 family) [Aquimarina sp. MAR_2010_214]